MVLILHHGSLKAFMPCVIVTNSVPNTDISTMDSYVEYYCTRAVLTYVDKALLELPGFSSHALSMQTNMGISTYFPLGSGAFMGITPLTAQ